MFHCLYEKAFNLVYDYLFLAQGRPGAGRHLWDIRAVDLATILKVRSINFISDREKYRRRLVQLGHLQYVLSNHVASEEFAAIPTDAYLRANKDWAHLLGYSRAHMGQFGLLWQHVVNSHLRMHSAGQDLGP